VITGEGFAHWLKLSEDDRLFTCLPLSHINARAYSVMGALAAGASLALEERFSASRFWNWLAASEATEVNAVGAMLQILLNAPPSPTDRAHKVRLVYTALAMGKEAHSAFEERFGVRLVVARPRVSPLLG
jgi:crotonobetaine/carnitine-CoA ligase